MNFSNPVKIMQQLTEKLSLPAEFVLPESLKGFKDAVVEEAGDGEPIIKDAVDFDFNAIEDEKFFIAIFHVLDKMHYVLIKNEGGKFYFVNSWDGIIHGGYASFDECIANIERIYCNTSYKFAKSGILI